MSNWTCWVFMRPPGGKLFQGGGFGQIQVCPLEKILQITVDFIFFRSTFYSKHLLSVRKNTSFFLCKHKCKLCHNGREKERHTRIPTWWQTAEWKTRGGLDSRGITVFIFIVSERKRHQKPGRATMTGNLRARGATVNQLDGGGAVRRRGYNQPLMVVQTQAQKNQQTNNRYFNKECRIGNVSVVLEKLITILRRKQYKPFGKTANKLGSLHLGHMTQCFAFCRLSRNTAAFRLNTHTHRDR